MARNIPIKFILVIILVIITCCNCQSDSTDSASSSWAKLQISPVTLSSMEYGNFCIAIYEHVNNHKATTTAGKKKYYYSPLALLKSNSAVSIYNRFTKQPEMRFRIEMWNEKVQNEVVKHLNEIVGQEIKSDQVTVIPIEKVILTGKRPTQDYSLSSEWTNYDKSKSLWLYLSCDDQKVCDELANEIRIDPTQFHHLKLLYSMSSQTWQTKQTTISIDSIASGQMVSHLLQKFEDRKEIFLTASDEKRLLMETATNIRMDIFDDLEVGSPNTELQIYNILKDLLVTFRTTIKDQSDKMWDSVFWNDDNYRPDRTTKTLNEIINKLDTETQKKLAEMFQIQHNYDSNSWDDVEGISSIISGKFINDPKSSRQVKILKEDAEKLLKESRDHVQWDGEKFVPKPMQLSRIDLGNFRDSQSFHERKVRVRYTNVELSAPLNVEYAELTANDEWNILKIELTGTILELEKTKIELEKTRVNLSRKIDDLSTKLNANSKHLEIAETILILTGRELSSTKYDLANLTKQLNARTSEIVDIGKMPTSCSDLKRMGHKLSGFFSVSGSKKMEMIYCDFYSNRNELQKWIGYADVKSKPVYFYVQRNPKWLDQRMRIPFDKAVMNEGNAMNLTSGIFTAPRPGIYFFSFTGLASFPPSSHSLMQLAICLFLNGAKIGIGFVEEYYTQQGQNEQVIIQSTLGLKKGDRVWVEITGMSSGVLLSDYDGHYTHFTGFLLEEDIVASF